jgi:membrane protein YdbS with pleckstrin-like domain
VLATELAVRRCRLVEGPFAPPLERRWVPVSGRLASMRRTLFLAPVVLVVGAGTGFLFDKKSWVGALVLAVGVLVALWGWVVIGRNWRSWGYAERQDDLLVIHGAMFKKLVVVPYGRMQLVDVEAGPVERLFGVVTVKLHTAAATTDARICGLRPDEAKVLRDRLTALGEAHAAGL